MYFDISLKHMMYAKLGKQFILFIAFLTIGASVYSYISVELIKKQNLDIIETFIDSRTPIILNNILQDRIKKLKINLEFIFIEEYVKYKMEVYSSKYGVIFSSDSNFPCFNNKNSDFPITVAFESKKYLCQKKEVIYFDQTMGSIIAARPLPSLFEVFKSQKIFQSYILLITLYFLLLITLNNFFSKEITSPLEAIIAGLTQNSSKDFLNNGSKFSAKEWYVLKHAIIDYKKKEELAIKELKRIDTLKDEFLANTSHELKTPLNGIIGISQSLINGISGKMSENAKQNLSTIVFSAKRLASLVNDILDYSRLKSRDLKLKVDVIDVKSSVNVSLAVLKHHGKNLNLINNIEDTISYVIADENRLQQILQNLIGNAVKFSDTGTIEVTAKEVNGFVEISVSDQGIGIPEERFEKIFKSFEQIDSSPAREHEGTGLGLSITKDLVEYHGGQIRVKSQPGMGSTFTFSLPVSTSTEKKNGYQQEIINTDIVKNDFTNIKKDSEITPALSTTTFKILVVDDDPINVRSAVNSLILMGYSVDYVFSGNEALASIEVNKPDLVLLDVMMPKMDGYEVCRTLRKKYNRHQLPIIFLTAKTRTSDLVVGFRSGGNDYIPKPFSTDELNNRVNTQLDLCISYERIVSLRNYSNSIGKTKTIEHLLKTASKYLIKDKAVMDMVLFYKDVPLGNNYNKRIEEEYKNWRKKDTFEIFTKQDYTFYFTSIDQFSGYSLGTQLVTSVDSYVSNNIEYINGILAQMNSMHKNLVSLASDCKILSSIQKISHNLNDFLFIQADDKYSILKKTFKEEEHLDISLGRIQLFFDTKQILPVHRSYLINPKKAGPIKKIKSNKFQIVLEKHHIPIGQKYIKPLLNMHKQQGPQLLQ